MIEDITVDLYGNEYPGLDGLTSDPWSCNEIGIRSALVPIIKNTNKRTTDNENYRPICFNRAY